MLILLAIYRSEISAVSSDTSPKTFVVQQGDNYFSLAERLSTKEAEFYMISEGMSRKKRKAKIDSLAANIILQTYLDKERVEKNERN